MGLFDKVKSFVKDVEESAKEIKTSYDKNGGAEGLLNRATDKIDEVSQKASDYIGNIATENKKIIEQNSDKFKATADVLVNTTQTVASDVSRKFETLFKNINPEETTVQEENPTTSKETPQAKKPTKPATKTTLKVYSELELVTLDTTPLEIVLEFMGAEKQPNVNSWVINDTKVTLTDNHWYTPSMSSKGAISLVSFISDLETNPKPNYESTKARYRGALVFLTQLHSNPIFNTLLSEWSQAQKASKIEPVANTPTVEAKPKKAPATKKPVTTKKVASKKPVVKEDKATTPVKKTVKKTVKKVAPVAETPETKPATKRKAKPQ